VLGLADTNILVYRFDPRFPDKQEIATAVLRRGLVEDQVRIPMRRAAKPKRSSPSS
jgi:hypothetical protein